MLITAEDTTVHETPNAVMTTFAAPSLGTSTLAAWRVAMRPGASGPEHVADAEQVWLVTSGRATVTLGATTLTADRGDALVLPAGAPRRIAAPDGLEAIVATTAGAGVSTAEQGHRPLPWAS